MSVAGYKKAVREAALAYVRRGWAVFPLHSVDRERKCTCGVPDCPDAGKHPRIPKGVKGASKSIEQVEKWFGLDEGADLCNIGLATGEGSGITVVDIDISDGHAGAETWAALIEEHGEPKTLTAQTGSGGLHLFFAYNSAVSSSTNTFGPGIDCRNDGGYVVAAPSRHRSGGSYAWIEADDPIAPLPKFLSKPKRKPGRPRKNDPKTRKYTLHEVRSMLSHVPADDRDMWRAVGIILGREFKRENEAWEVYLEWSDKWGGKKGRNHDAIMREAFFELSASDAERELTIGTIYAAAVDGGWATRDGFIDKEQFVYYAPDNNYIYRPAHTQWVRESVDNSVAPVNEEGRIIPASQWLARRRIVTTMTKEPRLEGDYIPGLNYLDGVIVEDPQAALFNKYRRASIALGDAKSAAPFVQHVHRIFSKGNDADQFLDYMAHRVQQPGEKPRFALLIAGDQGTGKDTAVEFCCPAIGEWNVASIDPSALDSNFNEFVAATLVRISEAANLGDMNKWAFNEKIKVLIAGNPDYLPVNQKYGHKFSMRIFCGVIITTNHLASGIYIPEGDRRYDVIESATLEEMGLADPEKRAAYFDGLYRWFHFERGASHVAAYLHERDISKFSPTSGQRKTEAHYMVVAMSNAGDNWLADALQELDNPECVRVDKILAVVEKQGGKATEARGRLAAAMTRAGYVMHRNAERRDGRWLTHSTPKRQVVVYVVRDKAGPNYDCSAVLAEGEVF